MLTVTANADACVKTRLKVYSHSSEITRIADSGWTVQ